VNTSLLAQNAYAARSGPTRTATGQEYDTFARVTSALRSAETIHDKARAIHRNRELWSILASDVAGIGNQLPTELRAQIFYLAEFTAQHSSKVLTGGADVDVLVDINTSIMRGLRGDRARAT